MCASVDLNRPCEWTMRPMETQSFSKNKGLFVSECVDLERLMICSFPPVLKRWKQINCAIGNLADHHSTVIELTGQSSKTSRSTSFRILNKSCSLDVTYALVKRKVPLKANTSILLHTINITYTTKWIVFLRRIFWRDRFYNSQGHYFKIMFK